MKNTRADNIRTKEDDGIVNFLSTNPGHSHEIAAQAEMMRRLKNSIEKLNESTKIYSKVLISLTLVLVGIGIFQFVISFYIPDKDILSAKIIMIMGLSFFSAGIYLIGTQILNELFILIKKKIIEK